MSRLAAFQAAEGQRRAHGEAQGINGAERVGAEGDSVGVVPQLNPFLELVDDAAAVDVAGQESQDVAALQLADDLDGHCIRFGRADDGGEARHAAVHQLDAPRAQLDVVDRSVQMPVQGAITGAVVRAGESRAAGQGEPRQDFRLLPVDEAHGLDALGSQQGGHAGVQRLAQVRRPVFLRRQWVQQRAGVLEHRLKLAEGFDRQPGHAEDGRQVVGGVGEGHRRIRAFVLHGLRIHALGFVYDGVGAADGAGCDIARH